MKKLALILLLSMLSLSSVFALTEEQYSQSGNGFERWTYVATTYRHVQTFTVTHEWSLPSYSYRLQSNLGLSPRININAVSVGPGSSFSVGKFNNFW